MDEVHAQSWPKLVHPDRREDRELEALVRRMGQQTGAKAFVRQQRAVMTRPDFKLDLPAIGVPTLVLVGDEDVITPPEESRAMHGAIPGSRLVVMEGSGRLPSIERPEQVTQALREWLRS